MENKRRRLWVGSPLQKRLLLLIFVSAAVPAAAVLICLYNLIFQMMAMQMIFPDATAGNIILVTRRINLIFFIAVPVILLVIWRIALVVSNRIAGPLMRMERELTEIIAGRRQGPIKLRKNDELESLVEKINRMIK